MYFQLDVKTDESTCPYRKTCHFYNMHNMSPHLEGLRQRFCIEWPGMCKIYKAKSAGRSMPITLWPHGMLQ